MLFWLIFKILDIFFYTQLEHCELYIFLNFKQNKIVKYYILFSFNYLFSVNSDHSIDTIILGQGYVQVRPKIATIIFKYLLKKAMWIYKSKIFYLI